VRTRVSEVGLIGRNTAGVRLIRTSEDEKLVSLERVAEPEGDDAEVADINIDADTGSSEESSAE
jgi:DNA gyrase subunit A